METKKDSITKVVNQEANKVEENNGECTHDIGNSHTSCENYVLQEFTTFDEEHKHDEAIDYEKVLQLKENEYQELNEKYRNLQKEYDEYSKKVVSLVQYNEVIDKMLASLNTIDQIAGAYRSTGDHELVSEQLEKVAKIVVAELYDLKLEEIPVYGKEINGEYMQSFGTAKNVKDEALQPHQVAIVMRRAFKHSETGEIIQNALVYTVPEEE